VASVAGECAFIFSFFAFGKIFCAMPSVFGRNKCVNSDSRPLAVDGELLGYVCGLRLHVCLAELVWPPPLI
jgi:hypothetical protein